MTQKLFFLLCFLTLFSVFGLSQNTLKLQVSNSTDDAEELSSSEQNSSLNVGDLDLSSSDLELVDDPNWNGSGQTVGIRFNNLEIPQGAKIDSAFLIFHVDATHSDATTLAIKAEEALNATTFSQTPFNISSRNTFIDSVEWSVPAWSSVGASQISPTVAKLVQNVIDQDGWKAGNSMAFILTGTGRREAESFDGDKDLAPQLQVYFTMIDTAYYAVGMSSDDAEELSDSEKNSSLNPGDLDLGSSDLELVDDANWNGVGQTVGIRFSNINLPKDTKILSAHIEFTVDDANSEPTKVWFWIQDTNNAPTFVNTPYNISNRKVLTDSAVWDIPEWTSADKGQKRNSPDLAVMLNQITSQNNWSAGNAIAFVLTGTGEREVKTFDSDGAPRLVIEYVQKEVKYQPELVKEIPNQELVVGWDFELDLSAYFRDRDSDITYSAVVTGTDTLPAGITSNGSVLSGTYNGTAGSWDITVTASSDGNEISDEFQLTYLPVSGNFTLSIFHNNDGESDMLPDSITFNGKRTTGGSVGQFKATLDAYRAQAASRGYNSVMLSSGDNFLVGLEYNAGQEAGVFYDAIALDSLDYDAICLGNHDFDFGTQVLADFINAFETNKAPYLSSNLSFENVPEMQQLVDAVRVSATTIIDVNGEKIGIIGLTTPLLPSISSPGNTIVTDSIVDSVQVNVHRLTAVGVNKIILISHLQNYNEDLDLASKVTGVDVIIAGGGDELLANDPDAGAPYNIPVTDVYPVVTTDADGKNVYIVTTPGGYRYLGNLLVEFDAAGEITKVYPSEPILVTGNPDADLVNVIETPIANYIGDLSTTVIALVEDTLDFRRESLRGEESNGGNLFADAILWQAKKLHAGFGVKEPQVAIQNSGGLRIESLVFPGDFTEDLTYEIAAFDNKVCVVEDIAPAKFLELIEHGVAKAPVLDGRFPQISGFEVIYYQGKAEGDARVKSITLEDGTPVIVDGKVAAGAPDITLATINFTANGGDGYPFAPLTYTTLGATYQQAFKNFLAESDGLDGFVFKDDYPFRGEKQRMKVEIYQAPALTTAILSEDFNGCETGFPSNWIRYSASSNKDWECSDNKRGASGEEGDYAAEINGYGADAISDDWLITPRLTLAEGLEYVFNFNSMLRYGGPALEVLYSTNYSGSGDPSLATWITFTEAQAAVDTEDSWSYVSSGNIPMPAISGNVYIAFRYTSAGTGGGKAAYYRIDDVTVGTRTLLYENFNSICKKGTYVPAGWSIEEIGTPGLVGCSSEGFNNSADDFSIKCNGYGVGAGEVWTITPLLALGDSDYELSFASKVQYNGQMPQVFYSIDYAGVGDPNAANWTEIKEASDAINTSFGKSLPVELGFINEDAYIAFKYVSEGPSGGQSRIFLLDEILIEEPAPVVNAGFKTIAEIQGDGMESPIANSTVTTSGIVTKLFKDVEPYAGAGYNGDLAGFFIQNTVDDGNDATSNGLYIYAFDPVSIGDSVVIDGTVTEYFELTEINEVTSLEIISSGNPVPAPVKVNLPLTSKSDFERYEGMLVSVEQELTVIENRNLENYGELRLSSNGLLFQPTQVIDPNDANPSGTSTSGSSNVDAVHSYLDSNKASFFILDDGRTKKDPNPIPYLDMTSKTLTAGSTLDSLTGILFYSFGDYRIHPTVQPLFRYAQREEAPKFEMATLKVASFNVLNYFNGNGQGGGFPTSRGAKTYDEFLKQEAKIVAAIKAIDADVVGLMEIENDGDETYSAIKALVNALNDEYGSTAYDYVPAGQISPLSSSPDEIAVGLIYKPTTVSLSGAHKILNNSFDASYNDTKNRPALAQTFEEIASGEQFTVLVNHFKSKGSGCDAIGDPNNNDGQGNCNGTRTLAAQVQADWIETDPTGSNDEDFIILGDLNSYGQEDPIDMLRKRGYTNLAENDYSYVYDGMLGTLDYAMANDSMISLVTKTVVWHINSLEPDMLSYYGIEELYDESPYRSSDHDPVIVGLNLSGIVPGSETYKVGSITQNCADTVIKVPITTAEPVENVIGYNLSVVFDNDKLAPTGGLFLNNNLINPAYIDYMTNTSKEDTLLISMFLNSDAPAQTYFEGEGLLMEVEFRPAAGLNLGDDQTEISVSSLIESYYTGSSSHVVTKGMLTSVKDSILPGQVVFWKGVKIDFNSANSILYAPTNIYGTYYDCKQTSSEAINPDANGYFNYDLIDGRYLKIMSDIEASVNVMPIINGYDAYLANSAILGLENFTPTAYQLIAMDVNLDGKVLAGDLSQINQRAVSAIPEFIQKDNYNNEGVKTGDDSKDWLFVETDKNFANVTISNVPQLPNCMEIDTTYQCKMPFTSFTGVLLGDVSGSFAGIDSNNELRSSTNAVILDVKNAVSITESNMVDIPVVINAEESIHDINFELVYNTNVVKFNSLIKYNKDASSLVNETNNKHVLFSAYSMDEYAVGKALYSLRFEAMDVDLKEANFQSVTTKMSDMDANFIVTQSTNTFDTENLEVNMYPNPASFELNMLINQKAKVVITNQLGQNVKTFTAEQGLNTFEISELNAGIYMIQIVINNNIQTYSLIIE